MKRFQDFDNFDKEIRSIIKQNDPSSLQILPSLPPKYSKLFTNHLDYSFVEKRRILLQEYIQNICKHSLFRRQECTLRFLQIDWFFIYWLNFFCHLDFILLCHFIFFFFLELKILLWISIFILFWLMIILNLCSTINLVSVNVFFFSFISLLYSLTFIIF